MIADELPLLDLFTRLREAGLPLGIDEYQLFLRALQSGFGVADRAALERLCRTLWVTSDEEKELFKYHFAQAIPQTESREPVSPTPEPLTTPSEPTRPAAPPPSTAESVPAPSSPQPQPEPTSSPRSSAQTSEWTREMKDEVEVARVVLRVAGQGETSYRQFNLVGEYFPVTRRQMKQNWRYLRRMVREGPPEVLDVQATVDKIGRDGLLLAPVLVPRRINKAELLLLLDQNGSMAPFHSLALRLQETASASGRLGRAGVFYFHNCPPLQTATAQQRKFSREHLLYRRPACVGAVALNEILADFHCDETSVLIFSDAGAARGGWSWDRIDATTAFLRRLRQLQISRVAWLNPMPRSRWPETSAGEIARFVPMFEVGRRGFTQAIAVLRGRLKPVVELPPV